MEMTDLPVHAPKAEIWRILRRENFENPFTMNMLPWWRLLQEVEIFP